MTELIGLRLAFRGLVGGLAGAYVWLAVAMWLSLPGGSALDPLRLVVAPLWGAPSDLQAFGVGLALSQLGGAAVGMAFGYFFGRFFTVRRTMLVAGPCVALLAWGLVGQRLTTDAQHLAPIAASAGTVLATILYGLTVAAWVPTRREASRQSGSPST